MNDPYQNAMSQLDKVATLDGGKNFDEEFWAHFRHPNRDIRISIPVVMDDGSTRVFEGYRVEYDDTLGPYKGGIRYHPQTEINEVKALAFWMAVKCAVVGIPMGGGKGGVTVEPRDLSASELERLSRGWVKRLADILGPHKDVPAPDVNTTPQIMDWMADEYEKITGDKTRATFTGKPVESGGSEGRGQATGLGGFYAFDALRAHLGLPEECRVVIQGFGNVGSHAARVFTEHGHRVVAVSDSKGGIYDDAGLDIKKLEEHKKNTGSLAGFAGAKSISNDELLGLECDLLVPAAFENVITGDNVAQVKAKAVLELANGPITPEAEEVLFQKKTPVIPDVLANSGGVTVSYFEWQQNLAGEHWSEEEVLAKLKPIISTASEKTLERATSLGASLRMGAFMVAFDRIKKKMKK